MLLVERIFETNDANLAYEVFYEKFNYIYNECIPNVIKRVLIDKYYKPWLSKAILKSNRKKNYLYRDSIKYKCEEITLKYKKYKNKLIKILRVAEKLNFSKRFARETLKTFGKKYKM